MREKALAWRLGPFLLSLLLLTGPCEAQMANWPGNDATFEVALPLIKQFEGFKPKAYSDQGGLPTIGYGTTCYPGDIKVCLKDRQISEAEAEFYLKHDLTKTADCLAAHLKQPATPNQAAAMLSLAYNIGLPHFLVSSVLTKFNAGDPQSAALWFLAWDKVRINGKLTSDPGIAKRRTAERDLFLKP